MPVWPYSIGHTRAPHCNFNYFCYLNGHFIYLTSLRFRNVLTVSLFKTQWHIQWNWWNARWIRRIVIQGGLGTKWVHVPLTVTSKPTNGELYSTKVKCSHTAELITVITKKVSYGHTSCGWLIWTWDCGKVDEWPCICFDLDTLSDWTLNKLNLQVI